MKGLLLSLSAKKIILKSVNKLIWQSYKQEGGCLVYFVYLATTLPKQYILAHPVDVRI